MASVELILASENEGKLKEFQRLLGEHFSLLSSKDVALVDPMPDETGLSYRENAELKAEHVGQRLQRLTFADDSGLEVEALSGAPGLFSARYGNTKDQKKQRQLLLKELEGAENRKARFVCVIALFVPDLGSTICVSGQVVGHIAQEERGSGGFGYDPIFIPQGYEKSFGELSDSEKDAISHRRKASDLLMKYLLAHVRS